MIPSTFKSFTILIGLYFYRWIKREIMINIIGTIILEKSCSPQGACFISSYLELSFFSFWFGPEQHPSLFGMPFGLPTGLLWTSPEIFFPHIQISKAWMAQIKLFDFLSRKLHSLAIKMFRYLVLRGKYDWAFFIFDFYSTFSRLFQGQLRLDSGGVEFQIIPLQTFPFQHKVFAYVVY